MRTQIHRAMIVLLMASALAIFSGCGTAKTKTQNKDFFTSGNREADQRAAQRMAKQEQLTGNGEGSGEKGVKKAKTGDNGPEAAQAEQKKTLFERLGGEGGISQIVDDFLPRVMQDPRVNWDRKGVTRGGFRFSRNKSVAWQPTPQNVALLKRHMIQFLVLATGGPSHYEGREIQAVHANMHIANPEFDAAVGDMKASLDRMQIPNTEQKELLAIIESTRPQIVTER